MSFFSQLLVFIGRPKFPTHLGEFQQGLATIAAAVELAGTWVTKLLMIPSQAKLRQHIYRLSSCQGKFLLDYSEFLISILCPSSTFHLYLQDEDDFFCFGRPPVIPQWS